MAKMRKKGKSGTKKYGRNKVKCEYYRRMKKREKNKERKLKKIIKGYKNPELYEVKNGNIIKIDANK